MIKYHMINPINKSYSEDFFAEQEQRGYTLDTRLNNILGVWHFIKRAENEPAYTYSIVPIKDNKKYASIKEKQVALDKTLADAKEKGWQLVSSGYKVGTPTMLVFKKAVNQSPAEIYDNKELERQALLNLYGQVKTQQYTMMPLFLMFIIFYSTRLFSGDSGYIHPAYYIGVIIVSVAFTGLAFSKMRLISRFKKTNNVRLTENQTMTHFNSKTYSTIESVITNISLLAIIFYFLSGYGRYDDFKSLALQWIVSIFLILIGFTILFVTRKILISKMTEETKRERNIIITVTIILCILVPISTALLQMP